MAPSRALLFASAASRGELIERLGALANERRDADPGLLDEPSAHRLALRLVPGNPAPQVERAIAALRQGDRLRFNLGNEIFYGDLGQVPPGAKTAVLFPGYGARETRLPEELRSLFAWLPATPATAGEESGGLWSELAAVLRADLAAWTVLTRLGLRCDALLGHSFGGNAALLAAGMVPDASRLDETLRRIARDSAGGAARGGSLGMLALTAASRPVLAEWLDAKPPRAFLSLDNCPQQMVVWAAEEERRRLEAAVRARGEVVFALAGLEVPVHTALFPVPAERLRHAYRDLELRSPRVPVWSAATAAPLPADLDAARELLAEEWRRPVRLRETVERLYADGFRTFVEAGPAGRLCGFVRDTLRGASVAVVPIDVEARPLAEQLQIALALLFVHGQPIAPAAAAIQAERATAEAAVPAARPVALGTSAAADSAALLALPAAERARRLLLVVGEEVATLLEWDAAETIDSHRGLFDLGLGSLACLELVRRLEARLGLELPDTLPFDHPTPAAIASYLDGLGGGAAPAAAAAAPGDRTAEREDVAIVGIGCRFPGADSPAAFWRLLATGGDAVGEVPADRWEPALFDHLLEAADRPATRFGAFLADVRGFDAAFFGISPREALTLDPQQRLLLEVSWEALEHGAIDPVSLRGTSTGVFVGISSADYAQRLTLRERLATRGYLPTGNAFSTAAGRLSYLLGLHGPSLAVDAACASSLVAVHLACQALRRGECDAALAGGVNLILSPETSVFLASARALSPSGRCRTFDAAADGYVRAEGCGVVVLERLRDARAAGHRVIAVIRGSAVNHAGRTSGLTVPSGPAQEEVIRRALADAAVDPDSVAVLEAHGTGTELGDPIEVAALGKVFARGCARRQPLRLSSVKSNLGHLEAAAGVAGVIKLALQIERGEVVPSLHCARPNPRIEWARLPFEVVTAASAWPAGQPRVGGVSSFGINGSNAHAVLAEPPRDEDEAERRTGIRPWPEVLTVSAHTPAALARRAAALSRHLSEHPEQELADVCFTSAVGRAHLRHRRGFVVGDVAAALAALDAIAASPPQAAAAAATGGLAFLFTGQGAQHAGTGRQLYAQEPVFRDTIDAGQAALAALVDRPLTEVLFAADPVLLDRTEWTQPALFVVEYALCALWRSWGIVPDAVLGHSVGEYVAACVAGVMSFEDGLRLVVRRGQLMGALPAGGGMLAVSQSEFEVQAYLEQRRDGVALAAVNGPASTVLSGPAAALERARAELAARGVRCVPLAVSHAFHSPLMEPALDAFRSEVAGVRLQAPRLRLLSNVTGAPAGDEVASADYWVDQARQPVRFSDGIRHLLDAGYGTFVEVGPRPVLIGLGQGLPGAATRRWLASLRPPADERSEMLRSLAALYEAGLTIDWGGVHAGHGGRRVVLPTYPFERETYWLEAASIAGATERRAGSRHGTLLGERVSLPAEGGERRFETTLFKTSIDELTDTEVLGFTRLPPSAHLALALEAAREQGLAQPVAVADLTLGEPLVLTRLGTAIHTLLTPSPAGAWSVRVWSAGAGPAGTWVPLATSTILPAAPPAPTAWRRDGGWAPGAASVPGQTFYTRSAQMGFVYGPALRLLGELTVAEDRAEASIALPAPLDQVDGRPSISLAPWEACFQLLGAASVLGGGRMLVEIRSVERCTVHRHPAARMRALAIAEAAGERRWERASIYLLEEGADDVVVELRGVVSSSVPWAAPSPGATDRAAGDDDPLANAPPHEREALVLLRVQQAVAELLRIPTGRALDAHVPLAQIGLDSLMAVQLANRLQQELRAVVPATTIIDGATLASIAALVTRQRANGEAAPPLAPLVALDNRGEAARVSPLSYGQRALWFLWQLAPESTAYNQSLPLRIRGPADPAVWRAACQLMVDRHAMLRTRFLNVNGEPRQEVSPRVEADWGELQDAAGEDAVAAAVENAHARPFDLTSGPAVRFRWLARGAEDHLLLVTMHHIACDGWSLEVLRRELREAAAALAAGRTPRLSPLRYGYHDFVRWQADLLAGPEGERLLAFWQRQLAPPLPRLDLPLDRPRPPVQTYCGAAVELPLDGELAAGLRALAAAEGVTLNVLLMAAFLALLHRWTRQRELVIGTPTAGRTRAELAPIVGYFVDPIVIRVAVDAAAPFRDLVAAVKSTALDAMAHRDYPFALLVEKLRAERDASRSPFFDVTFNFLSRRTVQQATGDVEIVAVPQADGKFDLTLTIAEDEDEMRASFGFNTDLFAAATVERLAASFAALLAAVVREPARAVADLAIAVETAWAPALAGRVLGDVRLLPVPLTIRRQAQATPDALALVAADGSLTYRELALRTSGLAARLRDAGVGPEVRVAIPAYRATSSVVALLAVLEAGGAYVPLETAHPPLLLRSMLERAGAQLIVAAAGETRWRELGLPVIELDLTAADLAAATRGGAGASPRLAAHQPRLDDLAYVMFTSGSTGLPKGVAVEHRSLANYAASIVDDLGIEPGAHFALASTLAADLGYTMLFPALCTGGVLHLLPETATSSPGAFAAYLGERSIDYLKIVPSHLRALLGANSATLPRRALFLGGDSSPTGWALELAGRSGCRVFNHYGPTETTVGVLTYAVEPARPPFTATLPLARPVAGSEMFLLDEARRPVPPGMPGELYVAGAPLARGYVGDPAATAERFVSLPGRRRAYRTGDLARQLADGTLLLLGREDRQLKVHGYRVELGHVEGVLAQHPEVAASAVLPDADGAAASCLLAWVVPKSPDAAAALADEVRNFLAARLPRQLVPARIAVLDGIPLTSNGKVDALALRGLAAAPPERAATGRVRDLTEMRLSRLFGEVLGVPQVGPQDDFFRLGGHSLLAVRLAGLIAEELGRDLPLTSFFTHPTVESLAALLREGGGDGGGGLLAPIQPKGSSPPLFCLPGAGGNVLYFHELGRRLGPDVPVFGLQAIGLGDDQRPPARIEEVAARYVEELRRHGRHGGPYQLAGHSFGALVAYEMARQLLAGGEEVALVAALDNPAPAAFGDSGAAARSEAGWLVRIATRIAKLYRVDLGLAEADLAGDDRLDRFADRLLERGVLPPRTRREQVRRYVAVYRANAEAAAAYRPPVMALDVRLVLFAAAERDAELLTYGSPSGDDALGWAAYSAHPVETVLVPGTHITMLAEPAVGTLAAGLRAALARSTAAPAVGAAVGAS